MGLVKGIVIASAIGGLALVAVGGYIWSGAYNVAADDPHWRPTYAMLEMVRTRSVSARAEDLKAPANLSDPARIRQGAGNYDAMCMGCHLAPGMAESELSKGLYPAPPNLSRSRVEASAAFWVIKHGIKSSGMPAWGKSMNDEYIWNMAAFLQELPTLSPEAYRALVDSSEGHSHGGGETGGHSHDEPGGHADDSPHDASKGEGGPTEHVHADGKRHLHDAAPKPTESDEKEPAHPHDSESPHGH